MTPSEKDRSAVVAVVWIYVVLLLLEGALRKWVAPGLSQPLLVIRDPVALAGIVLAMRAGLFPLGGFTISLLGLAAAGILGSLAAGTPLPVIAFGLRTNFLHPLFLFAVGSALGRDDVERIGRLFIWLLPPMAALMAAQFSASPDAWINRTPGADGFQMEGEMGRIRAAGLFSFANGPAAFFALGAAFLWNAALGPGRRLPQALLLAATASVILATTVSVSRLLLFSVLLVVACGAITILFAPRLLGRMLLLAVVIAVAGWGVRQLDVARTGQEVFNRRIERASRDEGGSTGWLERTGRQFTGVFDRRDVPPLGHGLGMGTNAAAGFLTGSRGFLLAENEWDRVVLESGWLLGLGFLAWRCLLSARLALLSLSRAAGGDPLPFALWGFAGFNLVQGQFGQPTALGFACISGGLLLASLNPPRTQPGDLEAPPQPTATPAIATTAPPRDPRTPEPDVPAARRLATLRQPRDRP